MAELEMERFRAYRHFGEVPPEPSLLQRLAITLQASEVETVKLLRDSFPLIIDVSHWTGHIDYNLLRGKVDGVIAKACEYSDSDKPVYDEQLSNNIQGAYDIDVPSGMYIFGNPQVHWAAMDLNAYLAMPILNDKEIKMMEYATKSKAYNFWSIDEERWWIDYDQYWQYQQGKISIDKVSRLPVGWLNHHFRKLTERTKATFPEKNPICYSGKWFVDGYMRDGNNNPYDWSLKYPWWGASYTISGKKLLWDAIKTIYPPDTAKPPDFNSTTLLWQFGYASLPVEVVNGVTRYASVDLNLWMGGYGHAPTLQGWHDWTGFIPKSSEPVPTEPPATDLASLIKLVDEHSKAIAELQDFKAKIKAA